MAGTPATHSRVVKDFEQPRKFLRDMRAKIGSRARKSGSARRPLLIPETVLLAFAPRLLSRRALTG